MTPSYFPGPRQRLDPLVEIRVAEIRYRVPFRVSGVGLPPLHPQRRRRLHDPVLRTPDQIVAPARQQVPRVHHDSARDGPDVHPTPVGPFHLQAPPLVLEQQRQAPVIAVGPGADLLAALEAAGCHGGVVQQPQGIIARANVLFEEVGVQSHTEADAAHEHVVHVLAPREEALHRELELGALEVERVRPAVLVAFFGLAANVHGLLHVLAAVLALLFDILLGDALADFYPAAAAVTPIGAGGRPGHAVLLFLGAGKEAGRLLTDGGEERGGDEGGEVGEVEETGGLEGGDKGGDCVPGR